ncbi:MAG TPA: phosphoribosyltransferase family protein, partial [Acidimicrobiia bacterium]|nr:phosphoribosyltransferase family protein [Acidimicrobiia bacterium]
AAVADALGGELGAVHALKIRAPGNPELAIGAVSSHGHALVDELTVRRLRMTEAEVESAVTDARERLSGRITTFGATPDVEDRVVIVVDDGVATGATLRAALGQVTRGGAGTVVCAVPVGPPQTVAVLEMLADEVICPLTPEPFRAVGEWYDDFGQTPDARVIDLLKGEA